MMRPARFKVLALRRLLAACRLAAPLVAACLALALSHAARAQTPSLAEVASAMVKVKTYINHDGATVEGLGREREGSGVLIDGSGLVLTIGYLMVEAHAAEVINHEGRAVPANIVGYDHETGFGLLRAIAPVAGKPLTLGRSSDAKKGDAVLIISGGGIGAAAPAGIVSRREFAGGWEYLLDDAIFTAPPHPAWSGAALVNREGKLIGIGSLIVGDATGAGAGVAGNMFVPVDLLRPILADLISDGRRSGRSRPWLGMTTNEVGGRLVVSRVSPGGPAEKAGVRRGTVVTGVGGEKIRSMAELYRKVWTRGAAGVTIPLEVTDADQPRRVDVESADRFDHLKLKSTF